MRINIAATKTNLLKVKKNLAVTREGYELLDEKRRILLSEITSIIDKMQQAENDADEALHDGYVALRRATVIMGRQKIEEIALSVDVEADIALSTRRIMGVTIPMIQIRLNDHPPYFSPWQINIAVDEVSARFKKILVLLTKLAELKITTLRLSQEAQKTIRKVKALEKVYIPYYQEAKKTISDRLDEESRDAFSLLKLIKQKMTQNTNVR